MFEQFRRFVAAADAGPNRKQFLRFLLAGGVNTLFGFVVYCLLIAADMAVWLSLLLGTLLGTVFNFFTTGGYVFRDMSRARFPRFVICYLLLYGINLTLIEGLSAWLSSKILSQAILILPMALLSFVLMARFVFAAK